VRSRKKLSVGGTYLLLVLCTGTGIVHGWLMELAALAENTPENTDKSNALITTYDTANLHKRDDLTVLDSGIRIYSYVPVLHCSLS
jgi:hypothetical protein